MTEIPLKDPGRTPVVNDDFINELAYLLEMSGRAAPLSRKALCIAIKIEPDDLDFIADTANRDFALQFVSHLDHTGNFPALLELCDAIAPILKEELAYRLGVIRAKLQPSGSSSGQQIATGLKLAVSTPSARDAVRVAVTSLQENCRQIKRMSEYKDTHDLLQRLEDDYRIVYDLLYEEEKLIPTEQLRWRSLAKSRTALQNTVVKLYDHVESTSLRQEDASKWWQELKEISEKLQVASDQRNVQSFADALDTVGEVIRIQPYRINVEMISAVKALSLSDLVDKLNNVHCRVQTDAYQNAAIAQQLETFKNAVANIAEMAKHLIALRDEHDAWQQLDNDLRTEQMLLRYSTSGFKGRWKKNLSKNLRTLCRPEEENWAQALNDQINTLEKTIEEGELSLVVDAFYECWSAVTLRFVQVDHSLKVLCDALKETGGLIETALEGLT